MESINRPKTGLGILIINIEDKVLLGKRKDCEKYGIPGGYLERFENWNTGASREIKEETGISINERLIYPLVVYNALNKDEDYHNIAIVLVTKIDKDQEKQLINMEPNKCDGWEWWNIDSLHKRMDELFWPNKYLVENFGSLITKEYLINFLNKKNGSSNNPQKEVNEMYDCVISS